MVSNRHDPGLDVPFTILGFSDFVVFGSFHFQVGQRGELRLCMR